MHLIITFYLTFLFTIYFIPFFIEFLKEHKILDSPGGRRINSTAIPRMGGAVIYTVTILCVIGFYHNLSEIRFLIIGSALLLLIGILDDFEGVTIKKKFIMQLISAAFLMVYLVPNYNTIVLFGVKLPSPLDQLVLLFFIIGIINAINLYDGLDGLVTGLSILVTLINFSIGWSINNELLLILSTGLIGSLLGFLKFNAFPARIFLGDSGSLTIGFFLVTSVLIASKNVISQNIDLTFSIILLAVPIIDTLRVMVVRLLQARNPFLADRSHLHHIILEADIRHEAVVFILHCFSILFAAASILYYLDYKLVGLVLFTLLAFILLFIRKLLLNYKKIYQNIFSKELLLKLSSIILVFTIFKNQQPNRFVEHVVSEE